MAQTWFTADFHLGHKNLLWYQPSRILRWPDIDSHNEGLCREWREKVAEDDAIFHIGDFHLGSAEDILRFLKILPGTIHMLPGNHDERALKRLRKMTDDSRFVLHSNEPVTVRVEEQEFLLSHYPMDDWDGRDGWDGVIHLHGHCHGKGSRNVEGRIDVGWDAMQQLVPSQVLVDRLRERWRE